MSRISPVPRSELPENLASALERGLASGMLVRLKIAGITTCKACQLARKSDEVSEEDIACLGADSDHFSESERVALRYAELFAGDYMAVDDLHYEALAQFFNLAEITELNMYCALMLAGGRMTFVQQAYES